jgi:hypothetical protein
LDTAEGTYIGQWAEDKKEGKGDWDGENGESYEGEWHSDLVRAAFHLQARHGVSHPHRVCTLVPLALAQRFGKGTWIDTDGARYDGKWVKNRKEGSGVMTYANGSKYSGNWQRDRRHGKVRRVISDHSHHTTPHHTTPHHTTPHHTTHNPCRGPFLPR